ncbi:nucleotide sugar dehydrogenase [candidate division KSB1 bacterium]|nr:nucleotide sugar dehydrogenase [candidate division KSB1 bacterium]
MSLETKLNDKTARICIVGLGYVGIPIAVEYAKKGFKVFGIDLNAPKVAKVNRGENYIQDVPDAELRQAVQDGLLVASTSYDQIKDQDVIYICVPTPFKPNKEPDNSYIHDAARDIAKGLRPEQLIILKSTTYPETTEKEVLPILEATGLKVGQDFYLVFSPERVDPGNPKFNTFNTPIVVGGVTSKCTELARLAISQVVKHVHMVSNPRVAEMEKLLENIFRSVNIALVNELARLCDRMGGIDMWEVVDAAATKPFGFMPFYPGPGIGGHCILVDPYFLSSKAREYDFHTDFIELAAETNEDMPFYVAGMVRRAISMLGIPFPQIKILMLGVAFKRDIDDMRNSPAVKLFELLLDRGLVNIQYNDPCVARMKVNGVTYQSIDLTPEALRQADVVVITTDHSAYDYPMIVENAKSIVDTRNATKNVKFGREKIMRLGSGVRF